LVYHDRIGGPEAFYQFFRNQTQTVFQEEIILQEVLRLRDITSQLGTRKLLHKMKDFFERHGFSVGRDEFFDLLRDQQLLIRRRQSRKPRTTFSSRAFL
jgi:hypothetical protein